MKNIMKRLLVVIVFASVSTGCSDYSFKRSLLASQVQKIYFQKVFLESYYESKMTEISKRYYDKYWKCLKPEGVEAIIVYFDNLFIEIANDHETKLRVYEYFYKTYNEIELTHLKEILESDEGLRFAQTDLKEDFDYIKNIFGKGLVENKLETEEFFNKNLKKHLNYGICELTIHKT